MHRCNTCNTLIYAGQPFPSVDTTIRNIDPEAYRRLRVWAAHHGLGIGEALSKLVNEHAHIPTPRRKVSIWDVKPWNWGPGNESASEQVDEIAYGDPHGDGT